MKGIIVLFAPCAILAITLVCLHFCLPCLSSILFALFALLAPEYFLVLNLFQGHCEKVKIRNYTHTNVVRSYTVPNPLFFFCKWWPPLRFEMDLIRTLVTPHMIRFLPEAVSQRARRSIVGVRVGIKRCRWCCWLQWMYRCLSTVYINRWNPRDCFEFIHQLKPASFDNILTLKSLSFIPDKMAKLVFLAAALFHISGFSTYAAAVPATPEVIPGPGLPSLASLGLTSFELYQSKDNHFDYAFNSHTVSSDLIRSGTGSRPSWNC